MVAVGGSFLTVGGSFLAVGGRSWTISAHRDPAKAAAHTLTITPQAPIAHPSSAKPCPLTANRSLLTASRCPLIPIPTFHPTKKTGHTHRPQRGQQVWPVVPVHKYIYIFYRGPIIPFLRALVKRLLKDGCSRELVVMSGFFTPKEYRHLSQGCRASRLPWDREPTRITSPERVPSIESNLKEVI